MPENNGKNNRAKPHKVQNSNNRTNSPKKQQGTKPKNKNQGSRPQGNNSGRPQGSKNTANSKPQQGNNKSNINNKQQTSRNNINNRPHGNNINMQQKNNTTKQLENDRQLNKNPNPEMKNNKKENKKSNKKHPKIRLVIKIMIILFLLLCVVGAGIIAGIFFGLFGDEFEITKDELKIGASNSVIVDKNGAVIANLSGDEKRKVITLADMSEYLPKAYVAIEDERYYKHNGVDLKRTAGAIVKTLLGNSSYGGSTITQQLVKNITKDKESSGMAGIFRKVKEWTKAYQVERMISKDQILELYLNILFVGSGNLHGVELGAEYYFNKSAKDLDLAECAFMAGINNSPNSYDPFDETKDNSEKIKNRALTVLGKMKELGYIQNEEDYNVAKKKVEDGLVFTKGTSINSTTFSYHTDAVIEQVINQVMDEKNISRQLAENYVYSSGLKIYSTVDDNIQKRLEQEYANAKYVITSPSKTQTSQSGMAIIDFKTGNVVGVAGGLGQKNGAGWNRATQMIRQTGSSMKPIAAVVPALEEKVITAATVYDDVKTDFGGYTPKNYNKFRGLVNIRQFIETSQNIPAVKIVKELTPQKSVEYLQKMGITSLVEQDKQATSIAIGGVTEGVSPLEMAAAYGTVANDGVYITPTFYTKVEDASGNVVLTPKQETRRVISEQNAYIAKTIIQEPVVGPSGTARYCAISGMDVAAKTGTTDKDNDRWLCGFTPYYSAATWYGYDSKEEVIYSAGNPAGLIWDAVMTDIHTGLTGARFTKPNGIVSATVCRTTGCLATTGCSSTYQEIFTQDNMPGKCEGHGSQLLCEESGSLATEYCPKKKPNYYGAAVPKERLNLWKTIGASSSSGRKVTSVCNIHTKKEEEKPREEKPREEKPSNTTTNTNTTKPKNNTSATKPNTTTNTNKTNTNTTSNPNKKPANNTTTNTNKKQL